MAAMPHPAFFVRHGRILETALRESLRESNRHKVITTKDV
jgi:hypothetical protein